MSRAGPLLSSLALLALLALSRPAAAQNAYAEPSARDIVVAYNTGLRFSLAPGVFIPTRGGDLGFSLAGEVRYGFDLGALVLAPGVRLAGYFPPHVDVLVGLATLRLVFPLGPFAPFVMGGAGPGYVSVDSQTGLAYLGGGGFMVHVGMHFAIGAEASYQAITGSDFAALFFGPLLLLAF